MLLISIPIIKNVLIKAWRCCLFSGLCVTDGPSSWSEGFISRPELVAVRIHPKICRQVHKHTLMHTWAVLPITACLFQTVDIYYADCFCSVEAGYVSPMSLCVESDEAAVRVQRCLSDWCSPSSSGHFITHINSCHVYIAALCMWTSVTVYWPAVAPHPYDFTKQTFWRLTLLFSTQWQCEYPNSYPYPVFWAMLFKNHKCTVIFIFY